VASSPLKGEFRDRISSDANLKGPLRTYTEQWSDVKESEIEAFNLTSVLTTSVIRKAASEKNSAHSLEKLKEAVELRKLHDIDPFKTFSGLIRNTSCDPFSVYLYIQDQMKIFSTLSNTSSWSNIVQVACDTSGDIFPSTRTPQGKKYEDFASM
jgi:hypothetical protein